MTGMLGRAASRKKGGDVERRILPGLPLASTGHGFLAEVQLE
jgi:hypothetical protein